MKTTLKSLLILSFVIGSITYSNAQVYVNVRPVTPRVVVARPAAPSPRHVWVAENWVPTRQGYRWQGGYYVAPPRPRAVWVPGQWVLRRRGYVWMPGYWR